MPEIALKPYCRRGDRGGRLPLDNGRMGGRMVCNNRTCPWCWWFIVHRNALVLTDVGRTAPNALWVTLTAAPPTNAGRRAKMKALHRSLVRAYGSPVEYGWVTEIGTGGGWHIHAIFHGVHIPAVAFKKRWHAIAHVAPARHDLGLYMLKAAIGPDRFSNDPVVLRNRIRHYEINAGQTFCRSRGFFLEDTTFARAYTRARRRMQVRDVQRHSLK